MNMNMKSKISKSKKVIREKLLNNSKIRSNNRIGPHNIDIISIIIGSLLGESYGERRKENGTRITRSQSSKNKEYIYWIHKYIAERGYCSTKIPKMKRSIGKKNKIYYKYKIQTYTYTSFNYIYEMFYKNGKKVIPLNIEEYITPLALGIWIQDEGRKTSCGIRITTNRYRKEEVENIIYILNKKYNIDSYMRNHTNENKYNIYIPKRSMGKLKLIIKPYMVESIWGKNI